MVFEVDLSEISTHHGREAHAGFFYFALINFRHAYLRSAKGCIFQIIETQTRMYHGEELLKSGDAIVILLKSRPERSKPEKFRLVIFAIYYIKKQLFNFCHFSPAVRFIPRPLVVTDSRNLEKKF
jgi:hypothetical protein